MEYVNFHGYNCCQSVEELYNDLWQVLNIERLQKSYILYFDTKLHIRLYLQYSPDNWNDSSPDNWKEIIPATVYVYSAQETRATNGSKWISFSGKFNLFLLIYIRPTFQETTFKNFKRDAYLNY